MADAKPAKILVAVKPYLMCSGLSALLRQAIIISSVASKPVGTPITTRGDSGLTTPWLV